MTDPAELGFDPARLARLDKHFARYVDDGRLPGGDVQVAHPLGDDVLEQLIDLNGGHESSWRFAVGS